MALRCDQEPKTIPRLHYRQVGFGECLVHEGERVAADEVMIAGIGCAAFPFGGFRGTDEFGLVFLEVWVLARVADNACQPLSWRSEIQGVIEQSGA